MVGRSVLKDGLLGGKRWKVTRSTAVPGSWCSSSSDYLLYCYWPEVRYLVVSVLVACVQVGFSKRGSLTILLTILLTIILTICLTFYLIIDLLRYFALALRSVSINVSSAPWHRRNNGPS